MVHALRSSRSLLFVGMCCAGLAAQPARAAIFKVGPSGSPGCTHTTLFDAISAASSNPGADEIRLLNGSTHVDTLLLLGPIKIEGGFASCLVDTPTGTSTLRALADNRAVNAISNPDPITLSRLFITGGNVSGDGGGIRVSGASPGLVTLSGVIVGGNTATGSGGGIYLDSSSGVGLTLMASGLSNNSASDGGGLACNAVSSAATSTILLTGASAVESNHASSDGGGLWIGRGCSTYVQLAGVSQAIRTNSAGSQGGGMYVEHGVVRLIGTSTGRTHVGENSANQGAGIFVVNSGFVEIENSEIFNNHASSFGGGIYVSAFGTAWLRNQGALSDCVEHTGRCIELRSNDAASGTSGAIFVSGSGAFAVLEGVHISGSTVSATGTAVADVRAGGTLTLASSVLWNNTGNELVAVDETGSDLYLLQNTIVGNTVSSGLIGVGALADGFEFAGNLFWNQGSALFSRFARATPPTLRCTMVSAAGLLAGLPAGTVQETSLVQPDPQFRNPGSGDFHLLTTSPALDACPAAQATTSILTDLDGDGRDWDVEPPAGPGGATRDIGADELAPFFADGFELGDTKAWDVTVGFTGSEEE